MVACDVELGHKLPVGGAGCGQVAVAFFELEPLVGDLLLQVGDFLVQGVDAGGGAEAGLAPGLLTEYPGEAFFELLDAGGEPDGAFVGAETFLAARSRSFTTRYNRE